MLKKSVKIIVSQTCTLWTTELRTTTRKVTRTTLKFLPTVHSTYELGLILADNSSLHTLNYRHRGYDKPTSVLSFPLHDPYNPPPHPFLLGDIYFAYETIQQEAKQANLPMLEHFSHLIVHSILHLFGYKHGQSMQQQEVIILESCKEGIKRSLNS